MNSHKIVNFFKIHYQLVIILSFFAIAYLLLGVIKHNNFLSGYDLSIIDQAIWKYSQLKNPITTTHEFYDTPIYIDHLEIIFILIAPLYWIFDSVLVLIVLQVVAIVGSGLAIFLICKKYKISKFASYSITISFLSFFGIQFSIWSDVHSLLFALAFMSWYIYFLEKKNTKLSLLFLVLAIISKEDVALLTFAISIVYFIRQRDKVTLIFSGISLAYLLAIFFIYFPSVVPEGYRFANSHGLLSDINPAYLLNTPDKQKSFIYSLGWFGLIPLAAPLNLLPFLGDLSHYFIIGNGVVRTENIFLHYRSTTALFLTIPTIMVISKYRRLNNWKVGLYLLLCAAFFQYYLHLPLSYLTKKWFWEKNSDASNISQMIKKLPKEASVATQNNIAPHIAHRDQIYLLFPTLRDFKSNSPCGEPTCRWFRVGGAPSYLLIDRGNTWNILHYLGSREEFLQGVNNLEKNGSIKLMDHNDTSYLYKIVKKISN